jgi:hypothetical protein
MTSMHQKSAGSKTSPEVFTPIDAIIDTGRPGMSVFDPEFSPAPGSNLMAYLVEPQNALDLDQKCKICVVAVDRTTGRIAGEAIAVTDQAPRFVRGGFQGPEWGYNTNGLSLFFTVLVGNKTQIAHSTLQSSGQWSTPVVLTGDQSDPFGRLFPTGSKNGTTRTQVNYTRADAAPRASYDSPRERVNTRVFCWMDTLDRKEHEIDAVNIYTQSPQFLEPFNPKGSTTVNALSDLLFSQKDANGLYQVVRNNTQTGESYFLTAEPSWNLRDPAGFKAYDPQYAGAFVVAASVEEKDELYPSKIAIYQQVSPDDPYAKLQLQRTLDIPDRAISLGFTAISSVETIAGPTLKSSFLALRLMKPVGSNPLDWDSTIWIWSLDGKLQRQVSGSNPNQGNLRGVDPEYLLGTDKLFIYYSVYHLPQSDTSTMKTATVDLHLCETGVFADGTFTPPHGT